MTESAQPLSRRERRAMEEAARAAEGDETQALPVAPETLDTMSRRERRRLERLSNPPETWTQEEELIATGQLPAMTPEVLAEQDRIAADAAAAQAYAETAAEADAVAEEAEEAPVAEAKPEPLPARKPEPAANEIPADLRHLFPPGSLQARAFEAQQAANAAPEEEPHNDAVDEIRRLTQEAMAGITKATTGPVEVVEPADTLPEPEPEPLPTPEHDPLPETAPEPATEPQPQPDAVPELPDGVDVEALWNAPTVDEPVRTPALHPAFPDADPEPVTLDDVPLVQDVPALSQPTGLAAPNEAPVWSALVPANPVPAQPTAPAQQQAFEPVSFAPVTSPTEPTEAAPTMWDTHPLTNPGATPVRELPAEAPQQDLPRPDLSVLLGTQPGPSVGQSAYVSTEPSTSTTSVPLRPAEPHAGGGARHFRWAHLAVIGAIAFVLGVLAWNIARSGS